jgi:hypothetical protein
VRVDGPRVGRHVNAKPWGTIAMFESVAQTPEPHEPHPSLLDSQTTSERVSPPTGETTGDTRSSSTSGLAPQPEPHDNGRLDDAWLEELARAEEARELELAETRTELADPAA